MNFLRMIDDMDYGMVAVILAKFFLDTKKEYPGDTEQWCEENDLDPELVISEVKRYFVEDD